MDANWVLLTMLLAESGLTLDRKSVDRLWASMERLGITLVQDPTVRRAPASNFDCRHCATPLDAALFLAVHAQNRVLPFCKPCVGAGFAGI